MLLFTYLRRELRHRMRQSIFIAVGLAVGIGLTLTVAATAAGVRTAQSKVLGSLYGLGTNITVTKTASGSGSTSGGPTMANGLTIGPSTATQHIDSLSAPPKSTFSPSVAAQLAKLNGVAAASSELALIDTKVTIPAGQQSQLPLPTVVAVDGVAPGYAGLGPLGQSSLTGGRELKASDAGQNVAVLDATYAKQNGLKVGSTVTIAKTDFTVVGLVQQTSNSSQQVFIPIDRAQALAGMKNQASTIYVAAKTSADVDAVAKAIAKDLPWATVTTSSSLADQVTGSLANTSKLANDLGRWVAIAALTAAFALAVLLTLSAVTRRVREFGTLKAMGWKTRRIVGQVLSESVAIGVVGAMLGVGLGYAGAALVDALAPTLTASLPADPNTPGGGAGPVIVTGGGSAGTNQQSLVQPASHSISVHFGAHIALDVVLLALLLGTAGGLLAGGFGGWRAGRLRPAAALSRVA